ncbi:hypothetical protein BT67DRAFT_14835 [Trichocladium antarcticum]|uniref:Uncharacterized protein n=1 Tax=Trichocladium antarcticum TaxID=1450529 RepID=A0AAN6USV7_9PEZI|nr:hypothetical protein BT67DRAFT_14835 [Trichocladium antarcticum]
MENTSTAHWAGSSRPSSSSAGQRRGLSFLGSIGRKKSAYFTTNSQLPPTKPNTTMADGRAISGPFQISRPVVSFAPQFTDEAPAIPESKSWDTVSSAMGVSAAEDLCWRDSPDRSSKESTLSRMTDLTIPPLEYQADSSVTDGACAATKLSHLDDARTSMTLYPWGGKSTNPIPPQIRIESEDTAGPTTPQIPKFSLFPYPQAPPSHDDKSVSRLIDEWYSALHAPAPLLLSPGLDGATRRGNALLPPNLCRPHPMADLPTRPAKTTEATKALRPPPIRFTADDPDTWRTPAEWARPSSAAVGDPGSKEEGEEGGEGDAQDDNGTLGSMSDGARLDAMSVNLKAAIRFWENDAGSIRCPSLDDKQRKNKGTPKRIRLGTVSSMHFNLLTAYLGHIKGIYAR